MSGAQTQTGGVSPTSFLGTVGALGWSANTAIQATTDGTSPGLVVISAPVGSLTSGNPVNHLRLYQSTSTSRGAFYSATPLRTKWILRRSTSSIPTMWRVGFMDDVNGNPPNNGIYFELRPGSPFPTWFAVQRSGGVSTEIDTTKEEATNFQMLEIRRNSASGASEFYINSVLKATIPSNLPGASLPLNLALSLAGQGDVHIDYVSVCLAGLVRNLP